MDVGLAHGHSLYCIPLETYCLGIGVVSVISDIAEVVEIFLFVEWDEIRVDCASTRACIGIIVQDQINH